MHHSWWHWHGSAMKIESNSHFDKAEILTTKSRVYEITFFYRDSMKLYLFCNFFWYKHQRHPYNAIYMSKWIYLVPTWKSIFPNHLWHAYKRSPDLDYQSEFVYCKTDVSYSSVLWVYFWVLQCIGCFRPFNLNLNQ